MIGQIITGADGNPLDNSGNKLSQSAYNPPDVVKQLFAKVQADYQIGFMLQNKGFEEFDGYSLLQRTRLDQQLFASYVGCQYVAKNKSWRWQGRKNTSRNKLIKILSRAIAGMLFPYVHAKNEQNEEDKMTARVMRILIEDHLKKAKYKMKFLYMIMSALVNPAVFVEIEYLEIMQKVKRGIAGGKIEILNIVNELVSGLALNIIPIDEILLTDFHSGTGQVQTQPVILRVQRISYDQARGRYAGKYKDENGKDLFDYVEAGKTRIVMSGQDNQTLFDIDWSEADGNFVQVITAKYRSEDLEVDWVGGVGMFEYKDCYNTNPFKHRRMVLAEVDGKQEWLSVPVYNIAMSGFEPLDPAGRFAWYKSGAFKEYWDDQWLNKMDAFLYDGTAMEAGKPIFLSGVGKVDNTVLFPYATVGMPAGATATPYSTSPNLAAVYQAVQMAKDDLADSMSSEAVDPSSTDAQKTATEVDAQVAQVKLFFTCFSLMIADLIEQIGALSMDCIIQNTTVPQLDYSVPEAISAKYKAFLVKGKEKGKDITNHIVFTDKHAGKKMTKSQKDKIEGDMYEANGGASPTKHLYQVSPYHFARTTYTMYIDSDKIVIQSLGQDKKQKLTDFNVLADPRVAPFTDQQAVADEVIEEFSFGEDPDKFKKKGNGPNDMMNAVMGASGGAGVGAPQQKQPLTA